MFKTLGMKVDDVNMKVLVMNSTSHKPNMLMEILKQNKGLKSKFEMEEHNLVINLFTMETNIISCVESICDLQS